MEKCKKRNIEHCTKPKLYRDCRNIKYKKKHSKYNKNIIKYLYINKKYASNI